MSNRKINIFANVLLPVMAIGATIALFLMFQPQETTPLFYINLGYTLFLEMIFFGYLNILQIKTSNLSTPFFAVFGIYCSFYIVFGVIWILVYSFILEYLLSLKVYIAVLILLTLLWIIMSVLTAQTDSNYKQTVDDLKK